MFINPSFNSKVAIASWALLSSLVVGSTHALYANSGGINEAVVIGGLTIGLVAGVGSVFASLANLWMSLAFSALLGVVVFCTTAGAEAQTIIVGLLFASSLVTPSLLRGIAALNRLRGAELI